MEARWRGFPSVWSPRGSSSGRLRTLRLAHSCGRVIGYVDDRSRSTLRQWGQDPTGRSVPDSYGWPSPHLRFHGRSDRGAN